MKTTLKIIAPPIIGLLMVGLSFEAFFTFFSGTPISFDFGFNTSGKALAATLLFIFLIQALIVFKMPRLDKIKKIAIITISFGLFGLLAFAFEFYAITISSANKLIGVGVVTSIPIFYCLGNALTLLAIQLIGNTWPGTPANSSSVSEQH